VVVVVVVVVLTCVCDRLYTARAFYSIVVYEYSGRQLRELLIALSAAHVYSLHSSTPLAADRRSLCDFSIPVTISRALRCDYCNVM